MEAQINKRIMLNALTTADSASKDWDLEYAVEWVRVSKAMCVGLLLRRGPLDFGWMGKPMHL